MIYVAKSRFSPSSAVSTLEWKLPWRNCLNLWNCTAANICLSTDHWLRRDFLQLNFSFLFELACPGKTNSVLHGANEEKLRRLSWARSRKASSYEPAFLPCELHVAVGLQLLPFRIPLSGPHQGIQRWARVGPQSRPANARFFKFTNTRLTFWCYFTCLRKHGETVNLLKWSKISGLDYSWSYP